MTSVWSVDQSVGIRTIAVGRRAETTPIFLNQL